MYLFDLKIQQAMGGIRASLSGPNNMCRDCSNGDDNYEEGYRN